MLHILGQMDSNHRVQQSKCCALPLGDGPLSIRPRRFRNSLRKGGRWDSNPRSPDPQSGALTDYATPTIYRGRIYRTVFMINRRSGILRSTVPGGIRTPDPRLRRPLLYPTELQTHEERVMGIEPTCPAWKAGVLPLNYTRKSAAYLIVGVTGFEPAASCSQSRRSSQAEPHPVALNSAPQLRPFCAESAKFVPVSFGHVLYYIVFIWVCQIQI